MKVLPRTITEAGTLLRQRVITCTDLAMHCLAGLENLQDSLHAMITITREKALAAARQLDKELLCGTDRGPLHGIPFVNKDLFAVRGVRTTVGSSLFLHRVPTRNAHIITQLEQAGAVLLGQANMSELAAVPTGRNNTFGEVQNPWKPGHTPGSSSSGSAAALAAGLCLAATGSDTGNSIRSPAGYCGVYGLRPTNTLISLDGAFPRAPSLDTAGALTRSARDMAIMLNAMSGTASARAETGSMASSRVRDTIDYTADLAQGCVGLRIATIAHHSFSHIAPCVENGLRRALEHWRACGVTVMEVDFPALTQLDVEGLYAILLYEFNQIFRPTYDAVPNKNMFDPAVRDNLEQGKRVSSATYKKALTMRSALMKAARKRFYDVDLLCTPTTPTPAPAYDAPLAVTGLQRRFLLPVSFLGLPALSVPCGLSNDNLPVGLQLIGSPFSESLLLRAAATLETGNLFPLAHPEIYWTS